MSEEKKQKESKEEVKEVKEETNYTAPPIRDAETKAKLLEQKGLKPTQDSLREILKGNKKDSQEEETSTNEDEEKSEPEESKEEFDYKAELEKLRKDAQNYKEGMLSAKAKLKEIKEAEEEEGETEKTREEKLDLEQVIEELDKRQQAREQERLAKLNSSLVDDTLTSLTDNEDEKELVKWYYENKITKSGSDSKSIKEDLEMARLLANRKRLESDNNSLKEILINKQTTSSAPEFTGERIKTKKSNLSEADKDFLAKMNERRKRKGLKPLKAEDFN